jgi:hypothetical protein
MLKTPLVRGRTRLSCWLRDLALINAGALQNDATSIATANTAVAVFHYA